MARLLPVATGGGANFKAGERFAEILQKYLGIIDIGINFGRTIWGNGLDLVELKLVRHFFNDFGLYRPLLFDKPVHKGMFA